MASRINFLLLAATAISLTCLSLLLIRTFQWPLISDAVLMHYVVFLMQHGMTPYRDIVDMNFPGSYLLDDAVQHTLGSGARAWRLFDYGLVAAAGLSIVALTPRASRFAGVLVAAIFGLWHIADGMAQAGQRDYVMTVLLLAGYASLFRALRTGSLPLFFAFGAACGAAATIKPQAAVLACFLLLAAVSLRRREGGLSIGLALGGSLLPSALIAAWLARMHALRAFFTMTHGLLPYHAAMARHSGGFLMLHAAPSQLLPILLLTAALMMLHGSWRDAETVLLLGGVAFGFFSFWLQGKAYPYHRYPLVAFLLVLAARQLGDAVRAPANGGARSGKRPPGIRPLAWTAIAYLALWLAPASAARALRYDWRSQPSLQQLQADLARDGAGASVQCMDTMAGCITVLDRMELVQATGFLYDCYFFAPGTSPVKAALRRQFLAEVQNSPPGVFVVTDQWCLNLPGGYAKLGQWPEFESFLADHYQLREDRPGSGVKGRYLAVWPFGYRLYVRHERAGARGSAP